MSKVINKQLFELTSEVLHVSEICFSDKRQAWLIVTTSSVVTLDAENLTVLSTVDVSRANGRKVVDAKYCLKARSYVIVTDDSSVVLVPDINIDMSTCIKMAFSVQPSRVLVIESLEIAVLCFEKGYCIAVKLNSFEECSRNLTNVKSAFSLVDIVSDDFLTLALCSSAKGFTVNVIPLEAFSKENNVHMFQDINYISVASKEAAKVMWAHHKNCFSFSVVTVPKDSKSRKRTINDQSFSIWAKYNSNGVLLFQREISDTPEFIASTQTSLWIKLASYAGNCNFVGYEVKYGTCTHRLTTMIPTFFSGIEISTFASDSNVWQDINILSIDNNLNGSSRLSIINLSNKHFGSLLGSLGKEKTVIASGNVPIEKSVLKSISSKSNKELLALYDTSETTLSIEASQEFLACFEISGTQADAVDWDILKNLCKLGRISILRTNPSIISQALSAERYEILLLLCHYISDLNEKDAVNILVLAGAINEANLEKYSQIGDSIIILEKQSATPSKKRKTKSREKTEVETESKQLTTISYLLLICHSLLKRPFPFSSQILSEALQKVAPSIVALFLRLFIYISKSALMNVDSPFQLNDIGTKHACNWIEALLDSNFSGSAMQMTTNSYSRQAIKSILEEINIIDESLSTLESVMGVWAHIHRNCGQSLKPSNLSNRVQFVHF